MSKWTPIREGLPGKSTTNPNRSRLVLTCKYLPTDDTPELKVKAQFLYKAYMREAYYDFAKGIWYNDVLGEYGDVINPSHWMELPADNAPEWISPGDRMPPPSATQDGYSENVLVVSVEKHERIPVTSASYSNSESGWAMLMQVKGQQGPVTADRPVTAWMHVPPPPDQY
jgi:hypothetical protein